MKRCVICRHDLSMRPEAADRRYWSEDENGWAHKSCDPTAPISDEERLLNEIFGRPSHRQQRENTATQDMAREAGHVMGKEYHDYLNYGTPSRKTRMVCSCGFETAWFTVNKDATEARRAHLKDAAIYRIEGINDFLD